MSNLALVRRQLSNIVRSLANEKHEKLEQLKSECSQLNRPDFIWHYLLQSFATMGSVRGWDGLIGNSENYRKVTYEALDQLSPEDRLFVLEETLRKAKVRMPAKKACWLNQNFEYINKMGGLAAVNSRLLNTPGRVQKIEFLKSFTGIGDKYARNIMMDVYHPDFRDSIAVDVRINSLSKALGLSFDSYSDHEKFYLDVAHEAGLNGWELDRIIFNFRDEIFARLE
jgi:hypothetical protein